MLNVLLAFVAMVFLQGCGGGSEEASKELIKEYEKHTKNLRAAQGRDDCNKAYKETEEKAVAWQKIKGKNQEEKDPLGYTDKVAKAQHKFKARLKICYDDYTDGAMDDGAKALLDSEDAKGSKLHLKFKLNFNDNFRIGRMIEIISFQSSSKFIGSHAHLCLQKIARCRIREFDVGVGPGGHETQRSQQACTIDARRTRPPRPSVI